MTEIADDEAIARARLRVGVGPLTQARAWRIRLLDRPKRAYYLIIFGDEQEPVAIAAVDTVSGEVMTHASLQGKAPHSVMDSETAIRKAALPAGAWAELVWRPCRASLSPFYPLWQVSDGIKTVYLNQQGAIWQSLEPAGPGG